MTTREDFMLISRIADRGIPMLKDYGSTTVQKIDLFMDIEFAHLESPMDLQRLLDFESRDFAHDIIGIYEHFNRDTKRMDDCFSPRCTIQERA